MIKTFQIKVDCDDEESFRLFVNSLKVDEHQLLTQLYEPHKGWEIIFLGDPVEEDEE